MTARVPRVRACPGHAASVSRPVSLWDTGTRWFRTRFLTPKTGGVSGVYPEAASRPSTDRPTLTEWRVCAGQLAAAYTELVELYYQPGVVAGVVASSRSLVRFRLLEERSG